MNNFLSNLSFDLIKFTVPEISGIANIVKWLIGICSSIAAGIILFTLVLKLVTFPFDFFSRYSMRKNSVIMEGMRPELEKLQKQYADDKVLYNQKMMSLYKKNGYSMWGSCLPTILTLVIFIVAINGFSSYSQYQNKENFYQMSLSYNSALYEEIEFDNDYICKDDKGVIYIDASKLAEGTVHAKDKDFDITTTRTSDGYSLKTSNGKYVINVTYGVESGITNYSFTANSEEILNATKEVARERSAEKFREQRTPFLWVNNIWMTDSPSEHPVYTNWESEKSAGCMSCYGVGQGFKDKQGYENQNGANMDKTLYEELTYNLSAEKSTANGYFILCILCAGVSFLTQLVMSKSQKAQMELQTVDGQGARQQKMMMWMMPIMMAFFSFMYTAAFSIYLILSSVISILTTFLINWVVDKKVGKNNKNTGKKEVIRGRVYNQPAPEKKSKKEKEVKKQVVHDFIPVQPDDKKVRDRLK